MKTSPVSLFDLARNACAILIVAYAAGSAAQNTPLISTSQNSNYGNASFTVPKNYTANYTGSIYTSPGTISDGTGVQSGTTYAEPSYAEPNYSGPSNNSDYSAPGSTPFDAGQGSSMPNGKLRDVNATSASHNLGY